MKALARRCLFAAVWLATAFSPVACQNQSAGERCDKMNGDMDCETGLTCGDSFVCCVPGSPSCNATSIGTAGSSGAAGASGGDAAADSSPTSEAAANDSATSDSTTDSPK